MFLNIVFIEFGIRNLWFDLTIFWILTRVDGANKPHNHGKGEEFGDKESLIYPDNQITII